MGFERLRMCGLRKCVSLVGLRFVLLLLGRDELLMSCIGYQTSSSDLWESSKISSSRLASYRSFRFVLHSYAPLPT